MKSFRRVLVPMGPLSAISFTTARGPAKTTTKYHLYQRPQYSTMLNRVKKIAKGKRGPFETPRFPPGDFNPIVDYAILRPIAPCRVRTCRRTRSSRAPEFKRQPPNCASQVWTALRCQSLPQRQVLRCLNTGTKCYFDI